MSRRSTLLLALLLALGSSSQSMALEKRPVRNDERPPRRDGDAEEARPSARDLELVRNILARYDAKTLTAAEARSIHAAFRDAGLRAGPALNQAVKAAGFDPDRLRDLAPPPRRPSGNDSPASPTDRERDEKTGDRSADQGPRRQEPPPRPDQSQRDTK
jgi:hypothetical protein